MLNDCIFIFISLIFPFIKTLAPFGVLLFYRRESLRPAEDGGVRWMSKTFVSRDDTLLTRSKATGNLNVLIDNIPPKCYNLS